MRSTDLRLACFAEKVRIQSGGADPRLFQIAALGVLLAAGAYFRDLSLRPIQIVLTFACALIAQRATFCLRPNSPRSYLSAIITALSLTLLLRADNLWAHPIAACAAIVSKPAIRIRGKHLFNPSAFGVIFALLILPGSWVSPGQWGMDVALAGWLIVLGSAIGGAARRGDISWAFLAAYTVALALRVAWLGQRWAVLEHQLMSGALLLFAFFMISDPMTAPDHRIARCLHAAAVAAIAYGWTFGLYAHNGLVWALVLASPMVPIWDAVLAAPKYQWTQGGNHETAGEVVDRRRRGARGGCALRAA